ncbi:MAG: hypothetical protein PHV82_06945 [Victivallaceae bacterium]|nr:hypothetical protein [Victivallaceae bacterium]
MIHESEIVMLLLCIGIFIFIINKYREYRRIPCWRFLLGAFGLFFFAAAMTVAESFIWPDSLNLLEHLFYMLSSLSMLIWCWRVFRRDEEGE